MSKEKELNSSVDKKEKKSFWLFPERINNIILFLIIAIVVVLFAVIITFAFPKRTYEYYPNESEVTYAVDMDVYAKYYSNYTYTNEKLNRKDYLTLCYVPIDKTVAQTQVTRTSIIAKTNNGNIEYLAPQSEVPDYFGNIMQRTMYPTHSQENDGYQNIHVRLGYNLKSFTDSTPEITTGKILTFNEEIIKLDKKELNMDNCNQFIDHNDIFSEFYVNVVDKTDTYSSDITRKISTKITVLKALTTKYHLDYQVFLVKGDEVYEVCGYYGISNVSTPSTEMVCTLPNNFEFDYVIAKAKYIDANGNETIVLYKQPFVVE